MSNFGYLKDKAEYALFGTAAIEAERVYASSAAMCAIGCRKALELAVKWVYAADTDMKMPYKDNLQSLIHESTFRFAMDQKTWAHMPYIAKLGNMAVHTEKKISTGSAVAALKGLFVFIQWIDYRYGSDYQERTFLEEEIPKVKRALNMKKIREQESLLGEKDAAIEALMKQIEQMSAELTSMKEIHSKERVFLPEKVGDLSEFETRRRFIDVDLQMMGWTLEGTDCDVETEFPVDNMNGVLGQKGYADYVLFGRDGLPLAVMEAKKASRDPNDGKKQARLYADCLERRYGRRPMLFITNGFETIFWDELSGPPRQVSSVFSKDDLQRLMNRRTEKKVLSEIPVNDEITNRPYQKEAIRAVCDNLTEGFRKNLLVMATGTGKTRTAASLTDVLSRGGYVTNVLFLADRTALVKQARDAFREYLPHMSLCNLCSGKDDKNARIVFSTYPTMLNSIDNVKTKNGIPLFTPAHFDLIIIDESHRSIFKKYKAIFEYFDAILVGLTATPKMEVDRNTYSFFGIQDGVPTYAYDYETAVYQDHVLVPYYTYKVKTEFLEKGIRYEDLSKEDRERYEEDFAEDGVIPEEIGSAQLNKFVFNESTVDTVIQDLMERGIKVAGGDRIGKTIIFAQNRRHAQFIVERIDKLYPKYNGLLSARVICTDSYAQSVIDEFKRPDQMPDIAVSVDMMDTGIDVPECVNLVFFKKVRSKTKFWQMIGRGTRLAPDLTCVDALDGEYTGKRRFLIFDYCGNFDFFSEKPNGIEGGETRTLSENLFCKKVEMAALLQEPAYEKAEYQELRRELVEECRERVTELNDSLVSVYLQRRTVEKFRQAGAFDRINEEKKNELIKTIAPLITFEETDEDAKRFDVFMYGLMITVENSMSQSAAGLQRLRLMASELKRKDNIPAVAEKLPVIEEVITEEFLTSGDLLRFERARRGLRYLIRFLDPIDPKSPKYTRLSDPVIASEEGAQLAPAYDFEDYQAKVNRYVREHEDTLAIHKLKHNLPLSEGDYNELERILTSELGSREDYVREYGDTPFGLLVRRIAKLDHEAAMEAFSQFINDESLNQRQIAFINKIIQHIERNGYMENLSDLQKPPFDKPVSFVKMFDAKTRAELTKTIKSITDNAVTIA